MATEYTSDQIQAMQAFNEATRPITLSQIVDSIVGIVSDAEDGELTPEIVALLDTLNLTLEQKVEAYHLAHKRLGAEAEACESVALDYNTRAERKAKRAKQLREHLQSEMERLGTPKIKTATVTAYTQPSESVECEDVSKLPPEYVVQSSRPDKELMKKDLKAGKVLGFAWLKKSTHLRFR